MPNASLSPELEALVQQARRVRPNAHAPYSRFHVGAALLTASGEVFTGVNVENASYSLTLCAERSAAAAAVTAGQSEFKALAIVAEQPSPPCGACRQFLFEFAEDLHVLLSGPDETSPVVQHTLGELLPHGFRLQ